MVGVAGLLASLHSPGLAKRCAEIPSGELQPPTHEHTEAVQAPLQARPGRHDQGRAGGGEFASSLLASVVLCFLES